MAGHTLDSDIQLPKQINLKSHSFLTMETSFGSEGAASAGMETQETSL